MKKITLATLLILGLTACGIVSMTSCAKPAVVHPGSINSVDNALYDTLLTEHAALTQARIEVPKYPAAVPAFNTITAQYNATAAAYKIYHASVAAGGTPDVNTLNAQVAALVAAVSNLIKQIGGTL